MAAILQLQDIHKSFGPQVIFDGAGATLSSEQKIAFIGRNGAGKSTLCKIITGEDSPDSGMVVRSNDLRLSYLEQHDAFHPDETVEAFLERYSGQPNWRCGKVAAQFQLKGPQLEVPIKTLSGGYQTRVKLTAMLLTDPNFLILDEPSNYLDLKTLILLEEFLQDFKGGFLLVSHDREFLRKTCDHTLEAEAGQLTIYPGEVEDYLTFKHEMDEQAKRTNVTLAKKREQLQTFVDRFRAKASKASQAKSKMKQIEKMHDVSTASKLSLVKIHIPAIQARRGMAFSCDHLSIGYPEKLVASDIHMEIDHGARVAVLGDNGQGKTTFLRTLAQDLTPKSGTFKWGYGCEVSYYAQHVVASLHPQDDVFSHLERMAAPDVNKEGLLAMAGSFLFRDTALKKPISVLSGGECARLCLAGLLLQKRSVLLLDEPTNHLDFETVEALADALHDFAGTVFFISHDRTFVHRAATEIVEVKDGAVRRYPGSYADYVYRMQKTIRRELGGSGASGKPEKSDAKAPNYYHLQKQRKAELRKLEKQVKRAEEQLQEYTAEKAELEAEMAADPSLCTHENATRYGELEQLIHQAEALWVKLSEEAEATRGELDA